MKKKVLLVVLIMLLVLVISGCNDSKKNNVLEGLYVPQINTSDIYELFNTPVILGIFMDGIEFKNDNTCSVLVENYDCSYKYEDELYKIFITDGKLGEFNFKFSVIDDKTLKDNFDYYWKKTNNSTSDKSISNSENNTLLKMNKNYYVVGTSTGKNAYISFKSDGTCLPNFYSLSNSDNLGSYRGSISVIYQNNNPKCTYTIKDNIISVSWLGTFKQTYTYKLGNGQTQTSDIGEFYIMKDIEFKYDKERDIIDTSNGTWKLSPGDGFFTIQFVLNGTEDNETNNETSSDDVSGVINSDSSSSNSNNNDSDNLVDNTNSNNDTSSSDSNNNSNNNNNSDDSTNVKINPIDEIKVSLTTDNYDKHYFKISNIPSALKEYYINGQLIVGNSYYSSNFVEIEREGENCVNYKLVGEDGYVREGKECYQFEAKKPTVNITTWGEYDCYFYLSDFRSYGGSSMYYNNLEELTITYDGVLIQDSPNIKPSDRESIKQNSFGYIHTTAGKHIITFTNRFGKVQTEEFEISERCSTSF